MFGKLIFRIKHFISTKAAKSCSAICWNLLILYKHCSTSIQLHTWLLFDDLGMQKCWSRSFILLKKIEQSPQQKYSSSWKDETADCTVGISKVWNKSVKHYITPCKEKLKRRDNYHIFHEHQQYVTERRTSCQKLLPECILNIERPLHPYGWVAGDREKIENLTALRRILHT